MLIIAVFWPYAVHMKINNGPKLLGMPHLKNHCPSGVSFLVPFTEPHPARLQSVISWRLLDLLAPTNML